MKITYLGHSVFYLEYGEEKILIDPFLRGNGMSPKTPEDFAELSKILVTHGHGDHIGDTIELAEKTGATVFCNHEIAHYLGKKGVQNIHAMHIGGRFENIKMTNALHGSGITEGEEMLYGGNPGGFLVDIGGYRIYHAGDTALMMDMKLLAEEKVDVALLPIGGNFTMDLRDAERAVEFIRPRFVIPMHYDTFEVIQADPQTMRVPSQVTKVILKPGEAMQLQAKR